MAFDINFYKKSSIIKPALILLAITLIVGAVYFFAVKKQDSNENEQSLHSSGLDPDKKVKTVKDVEEVMAKWVEANPQAIIASVVNMQRKMAEEQAKGAQKNIGDKKSELFNDKHSPSYAPRSYDITIVEFFDYNCGYCKKANPTVESLIKADSKVRVIYKEFPILGPTSEELSSVALAVYLNDPSSYRKFHNALMNGHANNKSEALEIAKNNGLNVAKIEATLKSDKDKIAQMINDNRTLGSSIGVNGTPGFVIGEELIPGALELPMLQQKIAEARKNK